MSDKLRGISPGRRSTLRCRNLRACRNNTLALNDSPFRRFIQYREVPIGISNAVMMTHCRTDVRGKGVAVTNQGKKGTFMTRAIDYPRLPRYCLRTCPPGPMFWRSTCEVLGARTRVCSSEWTSCAEGAQTASPSPTIEECLSRRVHGSDRHANGRPAYSRRSRTWSHRTVRWSAGYSPGDRHDDASSEGWALGCHRPVADRRRVCQSPEM